MTQTIRRAARRHRFVIIDQAAVEDARLSWAARGLLAYLLSRPDDWRVLINDLKKRGNLGRDGIYTLLRELRCAGYVRFKRNRDAQGRMRGGTYIVSEVPHADWPEVDGPNPDAPHSMNPGALPNTEEKSRPTTTTKPTNTRPAPIGYSGQPEIYFPPSIPPKLYAPATRLVSGLNSGDDQLVIDEWAGALAAGAIYRSPLGYLRALVNRFQAGDMGIRYASVIPPERSS
jgi:hypothetical protein